MATKRLRRGLSTCALVLSGGLSTLLDAEDDEAHETIKKHILEQTEKVKCEMIMGQIDSGDKRVALKDCDQSERVCSALEAMFLHGLTSPPASRAHDIWEMVVHWAPEQVADQLAFVHNHCPVGMTRGYVRELLNTPDAPMTLLNTLHTDTKARKMMTDVYKAYAMLRDDVNRTKLLTTVDVLQRVVRFELRTDLPNLRTQWSFLARSLVHGTSPAALPAAASSPQLAQMSLHVEDEVKNKKRVRYPEIHEGYGSSVRQARTWPRTASSGSTARPMQRFEDDVKGKSLATMSGAIERRLEASRSRIARGANKKVKRKANKSESKSSSETQASATPAPPAASIHDDTVTDCTGGMKPKSPVPESRVPSRTYSDSESDEDYEDIYGRATYSDSDNDEDELSPSSFILLDKSKAEEDQDTNTFEDASPALMNMLQDRALIVSKYDVNVWSEPLETGSEMIDDKEAARNPQSPEADTPQAEAHTPQAEAHTPQAEAHTLQAEANTLQAEVHTPQAEAHTPQAEAHTPQAEAHTPQEEAHTLQAEAHTLQKETHTLHTQAHITGEEANSPQTNTFQGEAVIIEIEATVPHTKSDTLQAEDDTLVEVICEDPTSPLLNKQEGPTSPSVSSTPTASTSQGPASSNNSSINDLESRRMVIQVEFEHQMTTDAASNPETRQHLEETVEQIRRTLEELEAQRQQREREERKAREMAKRPAKRLWLMIFNAVRCLLRVHPLDKELLQERQEEFLGHYTSEFVMSTETVTQDTDLCAVCKMKMGRARRMCHMSGQWCCRYCHHNKKAIIPFKIMRDFDFRKYPVCDVARRYLDANVTKTWIDDFCIKPCRETVFGSRTATILCLRGRVVMSVLTLGQQRAMTILRGPQRRFANVTADNPKEIRLFSVKELMLVKKDKMHNILVKTLRALGREMDRWGLNVEGPPAPSEPARGRSPPASN